MNKLLLSLVLATLLMAAPAFAIVNIESVRNADMEQGFGGEVGTSFSAIASGTDELRADANGRVDWLSAGSHSFAVGRWAYSEVNDIHRRRAMAHIRHVKALGGDGVASPYATRYNWEVFGQTARDDYASLRQRSLAGTGIRLNRPFTPNADHSIGAGVMSEWRQEESDEGRTHRNIGRGNFYLGLGAEVSSNIKIGSTGYFQPKLDEWDDFSAIGDLYVNKALTDYVSLRFVAAIVHNSTPPPGVDSTRQEYGFRVQYRF